MERVSVALVSLGCAKNLVDSEVMLALLKEEGFELTTDPETADVVVVNTCGFIETAREESVNAILEMALLKKKGCRVLVAAGCLAQRYGEKLMEEIPELDGIVGTGDIAGISTAIRRCLVQEKVVFTGGLHRESDDAPRLLSTPGHSAFIKIAEGCDNRCSYCAIPAIRGPYRSRRLLSVLAEAAALVADGVRELNLVAQDITLFGTENGGQTELPDLLSGLAELGGLTWIRLLYAYPERVDDKLIQIMAMSEKVCKYLDLPLQHAADPVLQRMGRTTTGEKMLELTGRLRRDVPGITLRSTFIVGFPGEGENEFNLLLEFLKEACLDRVGFFTYSREEGTPAARFRGQVPEKIKRERLQQAIAVQSRIISEKNKALIGEVLPVMLDGKSAQDSSVTLGRTQGLAPEVDGYVRLSGKHGPNGTVINARVTGFDGIDLLAKRVL